MSTTAREKSPTEKPADVLARLPGMWVIEYRFDEGEEWTPNPDRGVVLTPDTPDKLRTKAGKLPGSFPGTDYQLTKYVSQERIPAMLEQAKREAFKEAEALCDPWGTMHGGTAQRIKREIHKLAEEVK